MNKPLLIGALYASLIAAPAAFAETQTNLMSVHVLDTQTGAPAAGVEVILERQNGERWQKLAEDHTQSSGRIRALYPANAEPEAGIYRVRFETGDWYEKNGGKTFFPEIPVVFEVTDATRHHHIPLLLSPYGYSTYRGN